MMPAIDSVKTGWRMKVHLLSRTADLRRLLLVVSFKVGQLLEMVLQIELAARTRWSEGLDRSVI